MERQVSDGEETGEIRGEQEAEEHQSMVSNMKLRSRMRHSAAFTARSSDRAQSGPSDRSLAISRDGSLTS
jgi:hypothetical protein